MNQASYPATARMTRLHSHPVMLALLVAGGVGLYSFRAVDQAASDPELAKGGPDSAGGLRGGLAEVPVARATFPEPAFAAAPIRIAALAEPALAALPAPVRRAQAHPDAEAGDPAPALVAAPVSAPVSGAPAGEVHGLAAISQPAPQPVIAPAPAAPATPVAGARVGGFVGMTGLTPGDVAGLAGTGAGTGGDTGIVFVANPVVQQVPVVADEQVEDIAPLARAEPPAPRAVTRPALRTVTRAAPAVAAPRPRPAERFTGPAGDSGQPAQAASAGLDLTMAATLGGKVVGDLPLRVGADDTVSVRLADLLALLESRMDRGTFDRLMAASSADQYVPLDTLRGHGIDLHYDAARGRMALLAD